MKFGTFLNFCDLNSIAISDNDSKPQSLEYKQKKTELVVGVGSWSWQLELVVVVLRCPNWSAIHNSTQVSKVIQSCGASIAERSLCRGPSKGPRRVACPPEKSSRRQKKTNAACGHEKKIASFLLRRTGFPRASPESSCSASAQEQRDFRFRPNLIFPLTARHQLSAKLGTRER